MYCLPTSTIEKAVDAKPTRSRCFSDSNASIKSKLQHPPPGKPRAFDYFLCSGSGEFDRYLGGVGKIELEVSGFKWFSFRAPKSLIAINTCLDEMEEFKGRDRSFVSDGLAKKRSSKVVNCF